MTKPQASDIHIGRVRRISLHCGIGPCPAVYETDRDSYLVIGRTLGKHDVARLIQDAVAPSESAVEVPKELLKKMLVK